MSLLFNMLSRWLITVLPRSKRLLISWLQSPSAVILEPKSTSAAERSYPTSEVRGRSWEDPMPDGWQPRGATPRPRSGAMAERSYPMSEARDGTREEQPHIQGAVAAWVQEGLEEPSHVEGEEGQQ